MTSYLKIELFAYDLFHSVYIKGKLISRKCDVTQIYKDECLSDNDYMEVCEKLFYDAVLCRRTLYKLLYNEEISKGKNEYCDSVSDFYEYIRRTCSRYDWFGCLTVFERMFATCAFVINLCFYNRNNENVDIIKFGHLCWAIYFEDFTEEFYEQGGWNELKNVANSYTSVLLFLQTCVDEPENALPEIAKAVENYNLKRTSIIHECDSVSKMWVKSCINDFHKTNINPVESTLYQNCSHIEHILNELKRLCNPGALEVLQYDKECSERSVFESDSFCIPLTQVTSKESIDEAISFSYSSDQIGEDSLPLASSSVGLFAESKSDGGDLTNQYFLNKFEDMTCNRYYDISNGILDISKEPLEFESISFISDSEQGHSLSRSRTKMRFNHDTFELEETTISETDISSNTTDRCSIGEDQVFSTTDKIQVPQEMMNNQYQMLQASFNVVESNSNDTSVEVLSITEGNPSPKLSDDNQMHISKSEWDEKDLEYNASTPFKRNTIQNRD